MDNDKITGLIIGCAYTVYNKLGFGFLESIYEKAMLIEMQKCDLNFKNQYGISVYYDNEIIGEFRADIVVEDKIIVELKAVRHLVKEHEVQLVNYLTATKLDSGLLINFGENGVEVKRKYREYKKI